MDVHEAKAALDAAGVREYEYRIHGIPMAGHVQEGGVAIGPVSRGRWQVWARDTGRWQAWTWERGTTTVLHEFPDEDQACRWLVETLVEKTERLRHLMQGDD